MTSPPGVAFSERALAHLRRHAIPPGFAARYCEPDEGGGLVIRTVDAHGRPSRRRLPLSKGGPKVIGDPGRSLSLWWLRGRPGGARIAALFEGETDLLAAAAALAAFEAEANGSALPESVKFLRGLPVASVPGTGYPVGRLAAELAAAGVEEALLAFDADEAGRRYTERAALALRAAGIRPVPVSLPEDRDVADVLAAVPEDERADALANLLIRSRREDAAARADERLADEIWDATRSSNSGPPDDRYAGRRYDFAALVADAGREPPWRVEPVAADGHLTILTAAGGEGKTWAGMAFSGGVANGATVAGLRCAAGRAVIFDAENGPYVLGSRLGGMTPPLPADGVAIYDADGLRLGDAEDVAWMLNVIRGERANLVVLDSLRTLVPDLAENDSDEMSPIIVAAKKLARESDAAVLLLHHRGHDPRRDFRGTTAIRDQTDLLFVLERDEKDPERRWRRRLRCAKCRIAEEPEDRWLGIRSWRGEVVLTEAEAPEPDMRPAPKRDPLKAEILNALGAGGPMKRPDLARALGRQPQDATLRRALKELVDDRRVVAVGDRYAAAETGVNPPDDTLDTPLAGHGVEGPSPSVGGGPDDTPGVTPDDETAA